MIPGIKPTPLKGTRPDLILTFDSNFKGGKFSSKRSLYDFEATFNYSVTANTPQPLVDSDGFLKWQTHNIYTYSEQFDNADWAKFRSTITANSIVGPDGTVNGDTLTQEVGQSSSGGVLQTYTPAGYLYEKTVSYFAKAGSEDWVALFETYTTGTAVGTWFNVNTGTVGTTGTGHTATITDAGDGWWLCKIEFLTTSSSNDTSFLKIADSDGGQTMPTDGSSYVYIANAALYFSGLGGMLDNPDKEGALVKYITTTATPKFFARVGHHKWNGGTWKNKGLLIEHTARTNLALTPNGFIGANWTPVETTVASNTEDAPDGRVKASVISETAASTNHFIKSNNTTFTNGVTYCQSIYARPGTVDVVQLAFGSAQFGADAWANFDVSDGSIGTVGSSATAYSEDVGNGFYRISITATCTATGSASTCILGFCNNSKTATRLPAYAGSTGSNIILYSGQCEVGKLPTSIIFIQSAPAETLSVKAARLPYSSTAMSFAVEGEARYADDNTTVQFLPIRWFGSAGNYIWHRVDTDSTNTGKMAGQQSESSVSDTVFAGTQLTPGLDVSFKTASRHTSSLINFAKDGVAGTADTTPTALPNLASADMNVSFDYTGTIARVRMWARDIGDTGITAESL